ncbi:MAG TPA: hypothetical protein VI934_02665 [Candidatus Nanoarchaeia archaeon]|nr:hypothetical protein [Candidatus Nanoarchaeia archaeon]
MTPADGEMSAKERAKCGRCGKNTRLQGIEYCSRCLGKIVENRVKDSLKAALEMANRQVKQTQPSPHIIILCDEKLSLACTSAVYLAKKILGATSTVSVLAAKPKARAKGALITYANCSDAIATGLVRELITSPKNRKHSSTSCRQINIFESITENELRLYAKMKRIKYAQLQGNWLEQAIRKLQDKHPGTVEALARSAARLNNLNTKGKR